MAHESTAVWNQSWSNVCVVVGRHMMDKLWVGSLDVCVVVGRHMVDKLWVGSLDRD